MSHLEGWVENSHIWRGELKTYTFGGVGWKLTAMCLEASKTWKGYNLPTTQLYTLRSIHINIKDISKNDNKNSGVTAYL